MRILSLNAWGGALFDELSEWLPQTDADVLCLQEMTRTAGSTGWTGYTDGVRSLPQRADLFDDVCGLLANHLAQFDASDAGPVVVEGGRRRRQEFGLGLFVDKALTVVGRHTRFVHGDFADHDQWPTDGRPRIAQAVRIVDEVHRTVVIAHAHGIRDGAGKYDTPDRRAQAHRLAALIDEASEPGDLIVVCGDLNLLPTSETFTILGELGLVDLVRDSDTRTSHYVKPIRHASYLLISDPAAVARFHVVTEPEVSDHRALLLDLLVEKGPDRLTIN